MKKRRRISSSVLMTWLVVTIVALAMTIGFAVFIFVYRHSVIQAAQVGSNQAVIQVSSIVGHFIQDTADGLSQLEGLFSRSSVTRNEDINALVSVRSDVAAVTSYDLTDGHVVESWTGKRKQKSDPITNLSYTAEMAEKTQSAGSIFISEPHVESILMNYYPWVVSACKRMTAPDGKRYLVVMDMRFSQIAQYVDNVGIGSHGYCFILDSEGNVIYHPQQQLIYAGLKKEDIDLISNMEDGSLIEDAVIYTVQTREDNGWRIVGVSFVNEMISDRIRRVVGILTALLLGVLAAAFVSSVVLSRMISNPMKGLANAMGAFEKNAADFTYLPIAGTSEVETLSDSFGHMVVQIQELMEKVRNEEITLRKTELRALQAQINPHFLYNTLDSIAWMCEDGRTQDAVEMVNALARLFRISISKGHELIPIAKEVEHAQSYLKIQNFRYKNQFTYAFEVQEECLDFYCNKITLQPIIENAIYHGLNRMIDEGRIVIRIYKSCENVIFEVEDNGVGMTKEQCRSILKKESGNTSGIGIKNVNDRIRIYFGEQYGIRIESEQDVGTKVIITMPAVKEETNDEKQGA